MTTTAIGPGQVLTQEAAPETPASATEFAQMLGEVQSGAPPGPEPPPQKVPEEGAVTLTPNAGAQTLDLLPEIAESEDLSLEGDALPFDLLELLAAQVIPVPLTTSIVITQATADNGQKPAKDAVCAIDSIPTADAGIDVAVRPADVPKANTDPTLPRADRTKPPVELALDGTKPSDVKVIPIGDAGIKTPAADGTTPTAGNTQRVDVPKVGEPARFDVSKASSPSQDVELPNVTAIDSSRSVAAPIATDTQAEIELESGATADEIVVPDATATDGTKGQTTGDAGANGDKPRADASQPAQAFTTGAEAAEFATDGLVKPEASSDARIELLGAKGEAAAMRNATTVKGEAHKLPQETVSRVVRETADRIELMAVARANDIVTVRLDPQDLGSITMIVRSAGSQVDAQITASNDQVRMALEQNRFQLGQALESRGLSLTSLNVGGESTSGQTMADEQTKQAFQQQAQQGRTQLGHMRDVNVPSLEVQRAFVRSSYGVDVWI